MKSRGRPLRRIVVIGGILTALCGLYLRFGLLPGDLKLYALRQIEPRVGVRIDFSRALYLPFRGMTLEDIKIWDLQGRPLFKARALSVNLSLWTYLTQKRIVIQNLFLDRPAYDLRLDSLLRQRQASAAPLTQISGQIEVPIAGSSAAPSLREIARGPDILLPENVYLEQVIIRGGVLTVRDSADSPPIERVRSADLRIAFRKAPLVKVRGSVELGEDRYAHLDLDGTWDLRNDNYAFDVRFDGKRLPRWFLSAEEGRSVRLTQARYALSLHLKRSDAQSVSFRARARLSGAELKISSSAFRGGAEADISGRYDIDERRVRNFEALLRFSKVSAFNLGKDIARLDGLRGEVALSPDLIDIRSAQGIYRHLPFQAEGTLRSFKDLDLDLTLKTAARLDALLAALPSDQRKLFSLVQIDGACRATTRLRGSLASGAVAAAKEHAIVLEGAELRHAASGLRLTDLSARIDVTDKGIAVRDARFRHGAADYKMELSIPKTADADGRLDLSSARFKAHAEYRTNGKDLRILKGRCETAGMQLGVQGHLDELKNPRLYLQGELKADIAAVAREFALRMPALAGAGPSGRVSGYYKLDGQWNRPRDWNLQIDLESDGIRIAKLELDRLRAQVRMRDRRVDLPYIQASPYGGYLGARLIVDLDRDSPTFEARVHANNIDIARLGRSLGTEDSKLRGIGILQATLSGNISDPGALRGQGALSIRDGHLWETSRFKQMGDLVLVKVEGLDNVVFESMNATFTLRDGRLWTQDLTLMGSTVNLSMRGSVSFGQELDLLMSIQYSSGVYRGALDAGGIAPLVIQQASNLISEYRIGGRLTSPTYTKTDRIDP